MLKGIQQLPNGFVAQTQAAERQAECLILLAFSRDYSLPARNHSITQNTLVPPA
jgi:DNA-binding CsgD family transcriptional regulator